MDLLAVQQQARTVATDVLDHGPLTADDLAALLLGMYCTGAAAALDLAAERDGVTIRRMARQCWANADALIADH